MKSIEWSDPALRDLRSLDRPVAQRVVGTMNRFFATGAGDVKRLKGGTEFRLRSGDYRIRFSASQEVIRVLRVLHRSQAYR